MKQQRTSFEKAVYHTQLVIASGKSPTTTKKGPGRKHVRGCSKEVKGHALGWNTQIKTGNKDWRDLL